MDLGKNLTVKTNLQRRRRVFRIGALGFLLALTGCAAPSQQYATDKSDGVYFTVPVGWEKISNTEINSVEAKSTAVGAADRLAAVHWQVAYSSDKTFKAEQVLSLKTPEKPVVYVRVRSLLPEEINSVSFNTLRNLVVPISSWAAGTDSSAPALNINDDVEVVQKGGRGIHIQFSFKSSDGKDQTIDQTALMSNDHATIYLLIARCSSSCFNQNKVVINKIVHSFTVRGPK